MKKSKQKRIDDLSVKSMNGAEAANEFRILQIAFMEKKAEIMDVFENKETLDTEELQEVHRTYKNLCGLEDYFVKLIHGGDLAQDKLNSLQEKAND